MDELEIGRSEIVFVYVVENEEVEVHVVNIFEPFLEVFAGFRVQGSHDMASFEGFGM